LGVHAADDFVIVRAKCGANDFETKESMIGQNHLEVALSRKR
jgi:hypothetical protein